MLTDKLVFRLCLTDANHCELASKPDCASVAQNVNPIYNLLPDILSSLSADADLPPEQFQVCLALLLAVRLHSQLFMLLPVMRPPVKKQPTCQWTRLPRSLTHARTIMVPAIKLLVLKPW